MTLDQMRTELQKMLVRQGLQHVYRDATTLDNFINRAYEDFLGETELSIMGQPPDEYLSIANTGSYGLLRETLRVQRVFYEETVGTLPGKQLDKYTVARLDLEFPTWPTHTSGTPGRWAAQAQYLYLDPPPDTAGRKITVWAYRLQPLQQGVDEPLVPKHFHETIVFGAALRAALTDPSAQNAPAMSLWRAMYREGVAKCQAQTRRINDPDALVDVRDGYAPASGWRD